MQLVQDSCKIPANPQSVREQTETQPELRVSHRDRKQPSRLTDESLGNPVVNLVCSREPSSYTEVLGYKEAERQAWLEAMDTEFNSLLSNKVFSVAQLPEGI